MGLAPLIYNAEGPIEICIGRDEVVVSIPDREILKIKTSRVVVTYPEFAETQIFGPL